MNRKLFVLSVGIVCLCALPADPASAAPVGVRAVVEVYADGLNAPRGMAFGPDGALYVAEGGDGSESTSTADACTQVHPPVGPYLGGYNGRISRIDAQHHRTIFVSGLPSSHTASGDPLGPQAIAFAGNTCMCSVPAAAARTASTAIRRVSSKSSRAAAGIWSAT